MAPAGRRARRRQGDLTVLDFDPGTAMVVLFFVLLALRVPVAFALGLSSLYAMWQIGFGLDLVGDLLASGIAKFSLLAIPFFILAGDLMTAGGISQRLVATAPPVYVSTTLRSRKTCSSTVELSGCGTMSAGQPSGSMERRVGL